MQLQAVQKLNSLRSKMRADQYIDFNHIYQQVLPPPRYEKENSSKIQRFIEKRLLTSNLYSVCL